MGPVNLRCRSAVFGVIAGLSAASLTACAADPPTAGTPVRASTAPTVDPDRAGDVHVAFSLYTHCGIRELRFEGQWYARVGGLLDDGNANPPPGWGNPEQKGELTVSGPEAVFTDNAGHREVFRLRPGTAPSIVCA